MDIKKSISRYVFLLLISLFIFSGCGGSDSSQSETSKKTLEEINKVLPNGESFELSEIKEISNIKKVGTEDIFTTKIDDENEGFFVVNGKSVEGTFSKDGKTYSIGTFKDGQRITEIEHKGDSVPKMPKRSKNSIYKKLSNIPPQYKNTKVEIDVLFIYNEDFWQWCDRDKNTVNNKLTSLVAYTNVAFSNSAINTSIRISGSEKMTFSKDKEVLNEALNEGQKKLENQNDELFKAREKYHADIVFVIRKQTKYLDWSAGYAYYSIHRYDSNNDIQLFDNWAIGFADMINEMNAPIFAHEVGHIFGCKHDARTKRDYTNAITEYNKYANGYELEGYDWYTSTLMGYGNSIQYYSNPNKEYENNPIGIEGDGHEAADCARFINFSAPYVAKFRTNELINQKPIANAGSDKSVNEKTTVFLDGSGSSDDGTNLKYKWTVFSGTKVTIIDSTSIKASFVAPDVESDSVIEFKLTVTDDKGLTDEDFVKITITNISPPPVNKADAGEDKTVKVNTQIVLDATKSTNHDDIVSVKWYKDSTYLGLGMQHSYRPTKVGIEIITVKITYKNRTTGARTELTDTVKITVTENLIAIDDTFVMECSNTPINKNVLTNDIGISNNVSIKILKKPFGEEFSINNDGSFYYKQNSKDSDYGRTDTFTYQVSNALSKSNATVTIKPSMAKNCIKIIPPAEPFSFLLIKLSFLTEKERTFEKGELVEFNIINDKRIEKYEWKEGNSILSNTNSLSKNNFSVGSHIIKLTITEKETGEIASQTFTIVVKEKEFNISQLNGLWKKDNFYYLFTTEGKYSTYQYTNSCYIETLGYQFKKSGEGYQLYKNNELQGQYIATFEIIGSELKIKTNLNGGSSISLYKNNTDINIFRLNLCN